MEMGDFLPVPTSFQMSINIFMGFLEFILPFDVHFLNIRGSILYGKQ